jgi:membrane associated rhomboid family serine protease
VLPLRDNAPTRRFPVVTLGLIAANALVWAWELSGTPVAEDVFAFGALTVWLVAQQRPLRPG